MPGMYVAIRKTFRSKAQDQSWRDRVFNIGVVCVVRPYNDCGVSSVVRHLFYCHQNGFQF